MSWKRRLPIRNVMAIPILLCGRFEVLSHVQRLLPILFQLLMRAASGVIGMYGGGASFLFVPLSSPASPFIQFGSILPRSPSLVVPATATLATTGKPASSVINLSSPAGYPLIAWACFMALFRPRLIMHEMAKPMKRKEPTKIETIRRTVRWVEHWLE